MTENIADPAPGSAQITLVDEDGAPLVRTRVSLFAQTVGGENQLGTTVTDGLGQGTIGYARPGPQNLMARAYDQTQKVIAQSVTYFAADAQLQVSLTTAADGVVRTPSAFSTLSTGVAAQLQGLTLSGLREDSDAHQLRFLASAAQAEFSQVAYLYLAQTLGARHGIRPETFFGIFHQGVPGSLDAALAQLPDSGIDDTFTAQVLSGVLAQSRDSLNLILTEAVSSNVLPASYGTAQAGELTLLDAQRMTSVGAAPYLRGKTPLNDLLAAGDVAAAVQAAFTSAYAASNGQLGPAWKVLRADTGLAAADLATLDTTLSLGELFAGNLPLVKDALGRMSSGSLASVANLALLDESDWTARITAVDPEAASIPVVLPGDTPRERISRFAKALTERFGRRYPTTAFAGSLAKADDSAFAATKEHLVPFLLNNPAFTVKRTNIDHFVAANAIELPADALADLKTAQRLFRISPHYATVNALKAAGHQSAQSVYFQGRDAFVAAMTGPFGSEPLATMAYARAQMTYATALMTYSRFNAAFNGITLAAMGPAMPDPGTLANLPDLQALFGSLDYFQCDDCQSVYSPAAYLVDLLQYLSWFSASGGGVGNARDALLLRRPDIEYTALSCNNTNITLPYIDLVNEICETAIAPPATPVTVIDTTGTPAERRALPQQLSQPAYAATAQAVYPLSLPFDLAFAQSQAYIGALGTSRAALLALFAGTPVAAGTAAAIAGASLGVNPQQQTVINGTDPHQAWERWGLAENPVSVIDPVTRAPYAPDPADWVAALSKVPVLLNRTGLTLQQLYQLLEVVWVTQSGVTLQAGTMTVAGEQVLSPDTDAMVFTGLTGDVLDRANRFLRLWRASGLRMAELDWALGEAAGGALTDDFLVFLSGAIAVASRLGLPFQEVLSFWLPLETRDVTDHLGDEDTVIPATYTEVFRNPAVLASAAGVFVPLEAGGVLSGNPVTSAGSGPPTPEQNAITASLGLSADDVAAILAVTGAADTLSPDTLNVLLRYQRLASALSLEVADLILWVQLTDGQPFGATPADTLEFCRRLAVLRGTGLGAADLDYLLRDQSASQSSLAFTAPEATAVLQAIRDAIAKIPADSGYDPATIATIVVAALAAATSTTAEVVTPVLLNTAVLPLDAATISLLLAQTAGVDPVQFPALVNAFTAVAKAARLCAALNQAGTAFAFAVRAAASYGWLDPSALPLSPVSISPYGEFEALLTAFRLNQRQPARSPKLFDVLGQWLATGSLPPDAVTAITGTGGQPGLAFALNASVADVLAVAAALEAAAPGLTAVTRPGSLADMTMLAAIAAALDVTARYGISGATLVQLATVPAAAPTASAAMGAFQAQYPQDAWLGAIQPVEDRLRETRRDALVAYLLGPGPADTGVPLMLTTDDIYNYYLIDPEMSSCALMTRLLQASLAAQQFVQQCFLNLTIGGVTVDTAGPLWEEWSWRQQFGLWQAARQVFLYPENYVRPELRPGASPFFTELENDLRQSNCDADAAEAALQNYLRKLAGVANLRVAAHYNETRADGTHVLHVFARTHGSPAQWYYRTRTGATPDAGSWSAWQPLNLDITSEQLLPVVWDQRLHLIWPVFKQISEKQSPQQVPAQGGNTQPVPRKFWSVELAMSQLSAGQWQPKQTLTQKLYWNIDEPPQSFTFRGAQDAVFNLQLQAYYSSTLITEATLPAPESPLSVSVVWLVLPLSEFMDLSQDPTYALITTNSQPGSLATPASYGFAGQDLVYGSYRRPNPGSVPVNVLCVTSAKGQPSTLELLATMTNPRIVVPAQEPVFDSTDPFFIADPTRTYLVQPTYYTVSSSPTELTNLAYISQWSTRFVFTSFYHPYAGTFLRELETGGVPRLMTRELQLNPQSVRGWTPAFDFQSLYGPQPPVARPYPGAPGAPDPGETALDFAAGDTGAYSLYNWEIFYQAPMFIASLLLQNQQFQDALTWLEYIFNPTDSSGGAAPQRYWEMAPFNTMNSTDWADQQVQNLLTALAADTQQGIGDPATATAIQNWMNDPYDPHAVAGVRIAAYGKATVMKFLDTVIAWGDWYYSQYTAEMVSYAEQLYVLADMILGPRPQLLRPPASSQDTDPGTPATYASLKNLDLFSNTLVSVENVIVAPEPPASVVNGTAPATSLPQLPGTANSLLFCIPPNDQLLGYWGTVSQRLDNIRHCLNLQGQPQPLPLYAPGNPLALAESEAAGAALSGAAPPAPVYRFSVYLQKAVELTDDVRSYGALILSALEKKDAEALAVMRANQELNIQTLLLDVKNEQVTEAQDQIAVLANQQAVVQIRYNFYSTIAFLNAWETAAITLQGSALIANGLAVILETTSGAAHMVPTVEVGVSGWGGTPTVTATFGGENVGHSASSFAAVSRQIAEILRESSGMAGTMGGYQRRRDEWNLQAELASAELTQIGSQLTAAQDRLAIAQKELDVASAQIADAQQVSDFLTGKYTTAQLYDWMTTQLTTVYTQAYQLAFSLALQAQNAYQYELGSAGSFIEFGYWDSQHKGLTAGESLLFDLRRLETQYLAANSRELELTKHVSLALTSPLSLVMLRETGTCQIALDEVLFEYDHPGQYFRRLRSVAVTVPCVTGPYTGVNATLTLAGAMVRTQAPGAAYQPQGAAAAPNDPFVVLSPAAAAGTQTIATSSGQADAGLFDVNLHDERWLPFEGQGAISTWNLVLDPRDNNFDFSTITDVIMHVRYTARGGGDQAAAGHVRDKLKPADPRSILVSVRNTFPDSLYTFFNPREAGTGQTLDLPLTTNVFPYTNLGHGTAEIQNLTLYLVLTVPAEGNTIVAGLTGAPDPVALAPMPGQTTAGLPVNGLTASVPFAPGLTAPQTLSLSVSAANVPAGLSTTVNGQTVLSPAKVEDVLLVITYSIG